MHPQLTSPANVPPVTPTRNRCFAGVPGVEVETVGIEPTKQSPRCEEWTGALNSKGYGVRTIDGRAWLAHRAAYVAEHGPISLGLHLHHTCGNRRCVAVAHLRPVSPDEHNRSHRSSPSAAEVIGAELAKGRRTRRELVAVADEAGISAQAVDTALSRMPTAHRVGRGVYMERAA